VVLLSSAALETERGFGALAPPAARRVLVGGLGFGATARAARDAAPGAQVVVAEKVAAIVPLLRGELADLAHGVLDDPRITIVHDDVSDVIERAGQGAEDERFDAILLDVDNGPDWASFRSNARLYAPSGLAAAHRALTGGGRFAVWSGYPADGFLARLRAARFRPHTELLRERGIVRARAYVGDRLD
jgi:spermidine synthase